MSGIKRTIEHLRERAEAGDVEARATLREAGLWGDEEEGGGFFDQDEHGNNRCTSWNEGDAAGL